MFKNLAQNEIRKQTKRTLHRVYVEEFNYPPKFKSDDAYYDLVELSKPNDYPYLLMEFTNKQVLL